MNTYTSKAAISAALKVAKRVQNPWGARLAGDALHVSSPTAMLSIGGLFGPPELDVQVQVSALSDAVRRAAGDTIRLHSGGHRLHIEAGQSAMTLPTVVDELPSADCGEASVTMTVDAAELASGMARVAHAVAKDDSRYGLNGLSLSVRVDGLVLSASDGHRAASIDVACVADGSADVLVPRGALALLGEVLGAMAGPVSVGIGGGWLTVQAGAVVCRVLLLDGNFPDLAAVTPPADGPSMRVGREDLIAGIDIATVHEALTVEISSDTDITLTTADAEGHRGSMVVLAGVDQLTTFCLHGGYLKEALGVLEGDDVVIYQRHALGPIRIAGDDRLLIVVMPRRS